jgi:hypothetical protein
VLQECIHGQDLIDRNKEQLGGGFAGRLLAAPRELGRDVAGASGV